MFALRMKPHLELRLCTMLCQVEKKDAAGKVTKAAAKKK